MITCTGDDCCCPRCRAVHTRSRGSPCVCSGLHGAATSTGLCTTTPNAHPWLRLQVGDKTGVPWRRGPTCTQRPHRCSDIHDGFQQTDDSRQPYCAPSQLGTFGMLLSLTHTYAEALPRMLAFNSTTEQRRQPPTTEQRRSPGPLQSNGMHFLQRAVPKRDHLGSTQHASKARKSARHQASSQTAARLNKA